MGKLLFWIFIQQEALDRRQAKLDEDEAKQKAAQEELDAKQREKEDIERKEEQDRLQKLEDEKREREAKIEKERHAAHLKEIAPDKEKLRVFAQELREIEYPICKDQAAMNIVQHASRRIVSFADGIEKDAEQL